MKVYIKLISVLLALVLALSAVSLLGASAEEFEYTQPEEFIYGDVNLDGTVTVKDVTLIQKGLAKITYVTAVQKCLADPENTGYSVKNATAIQKYLANYQVTPLFGTEIVMASQDEFSSAIEDNANYDDDTILVMFKKDFATDYTLKDFPEYEFESIEKITMFEPHIYLLKLSNPGKENVLEAIESLDYRANLDLFMVSPDYNLTFD